MLEMQETGVPSLSWGDPLEKEVNPLQYSCLENSVGRGAWQDMTHHVGTHTYTHAYIYMYKVYMYACVDCG